MRGFDYARGRLAHRLADQVEQGLLASVKERIEVCMAKGSRVDVMCANDVVQLRTRDSASFSTCSMY